MDLRHTLRLQPLFFPSKEIIAKYSPSFGGSIPFLRKKQGNSIVSYSRMDCLGMSSPHFHKSPLLAGNFGRNKEETCRCAKEDEPLFMDEEEREEWRRKIREVIDTYPDVDEEVDPIEKQRKMRKLLADYPLVMEEEDPDWPEEDADGHGFGLDQFFNKITIKNAKKDNDDDENDDNENELVWQDDDYIRPIRDITSAAWEETVFKDISPLIVLVHNRYKRPKENEKIREELEKSIHIIWNCRLPSPRCVAIDAVVDVDLVSALQISVYPQLIFTKSGKILYREKGIRTADELSKIMAFFYFGAAKPPYLNTDGNNEEPIPTIPISHLQ